MFTKNWLVLAGTHNWSQLKRINWNILNVIKIRMFWAFFFVFVTFFSSSALFTLHFRVFVQEIGVVVVGFDRFTSFESSCINCDWPLFTVTHNRLCNKRKILNKSAKEWMKDNIAKRQTATSKLNKRSI